ncbi:ribosomal protein S18-alanine N-acetyltransferase [Halovenus halobia]|uniref:ribosomal protein S18-alanine N-acetyltransferase n=1 Tax=Halovenus halobia TaxID=3396622 RepID=UPI003F56CCAA
MTTAPPADQPEVDIRPAERADLLGVYRIETDSFSQPWPFSAFEQYLGDPGFLVAMEESVLGYVVADTVSNQGIPLGHIKDLAVRQDARGNGVGTELLRHAIGTLESQGVHAIKLEVREGNQRAIELYRAHGFEQQRSIDGYYDDGEDALLLVRSA